MLQTTTTPGGGRRRSASERQHAMLGIAIDEHEVTHYDWRLALWAIGKGISGRKLALEITGFAHEDTFLVTYRWTAITGE